MVRLRIIRFLFLCLGLCGCACQDALFFSLPLVGIIQGSTEVEAYNLTYQGVIDGLKEAGYHDGLSIRLKGITVANQPERAVLAAQELVQARARLLICLGTIPALAALQTTKGLDIPIVYSIVGAPAATGLQRPEMAKDVHFTGVSMEVPALEQLQMLRLAVPKIKRLGVLYCPQTPQAEATAREMKEAAQLLGLKVFSQTVSGEQLKDLPAGLAPLLAQRIDVLITPTDPILDLPQNLQIICREAAKAGIPVQVVAGDLVPFGALLAYHCDFYDIGRQAGRQAGRILAGVPPGLVPPEKPRLKKLTLNLKTAKTLNLKLNRSLLSLANNLLQ